jgi:uncharacterized protein
MDPQEYRQEVEAWRGRRLAALTGPEGWLSVVGISWLHEGANTVWTGPTLDADVGIPGGASVRIGWIHLRDGRAEAHFRPEAGVTGPDGRVVERLPLEDDERGSPTMLHVGTTSFHLIRRGGRLAVRVRDPESPFRRRFTRIAHFPVDPAWRVEARFEAFEPGRMAVVRAVLVSEQTYAVPGALVFDHDGTTHRLGAFLEHPDDDLFIVFGDATNEIDTYRGGRFLYARQADERGVVVLDFNRAYNPPCVFTPFATCPLPLPENRLPFRVEAGERRYDWPAELAWEPG